MLATMRALATILAVSSLASAVAGGVITLRPQEPLRQQHIVFGSEGALYSLQGLQPGQGYEVRVSYPATIPAFITFEWVDVPDDPTEFTSLHRPSRRLLNLEKVMFLADANGQGPGHLRLTAQKEGIHRDGMHAGHPLLFFNIELAPTFGSIPVAAFPVILYIILGLIVIALWLPALQARFIPAMVKWIAAA